MVNVNSVYSGKSFTFNAASTQRGNCGGSPHRNFCSIPTQRSSMDNNNGTILTLVTYLSMLSDGENASFIDQVQVLVKLPYIS